MIRLADLLKQPPNVIDKSAGSKKSKKNKPVPPAIVPSVSTVPIVEPVKVKTTVKKDDNDTSSINTLAEYLLNKKLDSLEQNKGEKPTAIPVPSIKKKSPEVTLTSKISGEKTEVKSNIPSAEDLYDELIILGKDLSDIYLSGEKYLPPEYHDVVARLTERTLAGDDEIYGFTLESTPKMYLYAHIPNVTILAGRIGKTAGVSNEEIDMLIQAALFHDVAMVNFVDLISQPRKLSMEEFTPVKAHSYMAADFVREIGELKPNLRGQISEIIMQTHERVNGLGYPHGLVGTEINLLSQIIGLADTYEAMTHFRPFREALSPPNVIDELLKLRKVLFDARLAKVLIDVLSVYPIGSIIRLSTDELARVIRTNIGHPTRPVIEITTDAKGNKITKPAIINLVHTPMLWIKNTEKEKSGLDKGV